MPVETVRWEGDAPSIIDQRLLPARLERVRLETIEQTAEAIRTLAVRGAPAIGITAALALAALAVRTRSDGAEVLLTALEEGARRLLATRPTAVNLQWALSRTLSAARRAAEGGSTAIREAVVSEAQAILEEDAAACRAIGEAGLGLLPEEFTALTHCNAGGLATSGRGTALAPIYRAAELGRRVHVFCDETRPLLQGARLTAWELAQSGIPCTVICDGAAGALLAAGRVDLVIVGADRITLSGDFANKIGTYPLSVLARTHGVPFYVAAPTSTIDPALEHGSQIPIEERDPREVTHPLGLQAAPEGVSAWNPAFDVTPAANVTAFITELGVATPPFERSLAAMVEKSPWHRR